MHALFVGLGGVGQRHLRNLRSLLGGDVRLSAYRVRGETQVLDDRLRVVEGANLEELYGLKTHSSLQDALETKPDIVFVTNPTRSHIPVAQAAAEAGAHLFIEKPLSDSTLGLETLIETVRAQERVALVAYQLRQHPGFRQIQRWLAERAIGNTLAVRAEVGEYMPGFHPYEDYRRMYAARADLGGGVVLTQIHEVDLLYALFGTPVRVFALGGQLSTLEIDVEDVSMALLEYRRPDGKTLPVHLHQDYVQRPASRGLRIIGEAGLIEWNMSGKFLKRHDASGNVVESHDFGELPRNQLFMDELKYFLECVRTGNCATEIDLAAGARSLEIALHIRRSLETGMPVNVEPELP